MESTQPVEFDAAGTPIQATEYDASGNPIGAPKNVPRGTSLAPIHVTPDIASDMFKAGVHAKMLGVTPATAYEGRDEADKQLRTQAGNYDDGQLDPTLANDIKVGLEGSIFGLMKNRKLPDQVHNPGKMDAFVSGVFQMLADAPFMYLGGAAGKVAGSAISPAGAAVGGGIGAFALPAAMREALVQGIKNGGVKDMPDLLRRMGDVTLAATKGAVVGAATELAGGLPVGKFLGKSAVATSAVKGVYQATALTTAADLLEGHLPTANDFAGNAALIVPLNLITHGVLLRHDAAKQALMDVYAKDGKTPQESTDTLNAQPPVKPDAPPGLRPAIQHADGVTEGDAGETHNDVTERVLGKRAVSLESLDKDPTRADRVLENPEIHQQEVIDRAYELKKEAIEAGEAYDYQPLDTSEPVSGKVYHGTKAPISSVTELDPGSHGDEQALYGVGAYFTDSRDVAKSYAENKGKGETGRVLTGNLSKAKLLDIEKPVPPEAHKVFQDAISGISGDDTPIPTDIPGKELYKRLQSEMEDAGYTRGDAQEVLGNLNVELRQKGFDGLRHEGGKGNKPKHNVAIVFPDYGVGRPLTDIVTEGEKPLSIDELYDRASLKSGRGFVTPDGQFLSRMEARKWMKDNEPDTHEMWLTEQNGDKQTELRSEDYAAARNRAQARAVAEGDAVMAQVSPENAQRLAAAREGLNKIKAGDASKGYGKEVLRTLFAGQRDTRIAATTQLRDSLKKLIPDFHDQEALSILRDYKETPDKLAADLERIRTEGTDREKALIPSIERAMNPTPKMLEADQKLTDYYSAALNEGRVLGFMDSTIDPSHYSPHILTRILEGEKPTSGGKGPVMTTSTPFAKERSYPTILDALKTEKIDARTVNALDALSVYGDRHATVVATKLLATELRNTELGKYGTSGEHPNGWVELAPNQGAFRNTRAIVDQETGQGFVMSQSLYVPKDVADAMKPLFEAGLGSTKLAPLLHAQGYVKMLELGLSFFHVKALTVTAFNNMGLADFTRAMASDLKSPEFAEAERQWAADGLTTAKTSTPYEAYQGLKQSSIPSGLDKLRSAPVISQLDSAFKATTEFTFDVIQRKFKVQDASLKGAKWLANHPDATNEQWFAARRSITKEVNSAYGGLNWDVLGTGKTVRDVSRLFLLAPDWTFSNVLTAKYAFEGGPAGSAARMFWAKSFATGFAMTAAASIAIGGKYDPSDVKHIDQVYLGTDKNGKEMYANWFFAGAPKDAMTLAKRTASDSPIAATAEFIVGKASPALGMLGNLAANKQGTGAPIFKKDDSAAKQTADQAKFVVGRVVPITGVSAVKTVEQALTDPNHDYSYKDLLELAADAVGSPTMRSGGGGGGGSTSTSSAQRFQSTRTSGKSRFSIRSGR